MTTQRLSIGFVVNPFAGIGGAVALKGSDGAETREKALQLGAELKAGCRAEQTLSVIEPYRDRIQFVTAAGAMGADLLEQRGFFYQSVYQPDQQQTSAEDTQQAVQCIQQQGVDILVFAGGDGTARDVYQCLNETQLVLGIPAGVKIHSGVYAVSPKAAGRVIERLIKGQLSSLHLADVMDIDEELFRQGIVKARRFGEMLIPAELEYVQAVKMGGKESNELVLADIAAEVIERTDDEHLIMGSGSTVAAIMEEMGLDNTLLGVDWVHQQQLLARDLTEAELYQRVKEQNPGRVKLVITLIGGQGHIFGRGNQQLSPRILRHVGRDNIYLVATKKKLEGLQGKPLLMDSGDEALDKDWSGLITVITGYHDEVVVRLQAIE
ncbi:ATP-NAD kinase family protein [Idiomarina seosinensis]|uniref:ATP-NAD kinase family protein n=1 Tax=Idiomarina seosinensis TaxID=281739 RepID=UPI00385119C1